MSRAEGHSIPLSFRTHHINIQVGFVKPQQTSDNFEPVDLGFAKPHENLLIKLAIEIIPVIGIEIVAIPNHDHAEIKVTSQIDDEVR